MVEHAPDLSLVFGALADPTRRRLLEMLRDGERRVTELAEPFRMSLAAVSKHLRVLEQAGLLVRRRDGRVHNLRANPQALSEAHEWIERYARGWDESFDALDRFLAQKHGPPGAQTRNKGKSKE
jgi:DNA-binding transcriptional ArsR family regulator